MPLLCRRFYGPRNERRARMSFFVGKMAKDIDEPSAKLVAQLTQYRAQPAAVRTKVIAVEDEGYRVSRSRIAADMVVLGVNVVPQPQSLGISFVRHQFAVLAGVSEPADLCVAQVA